MDRDEDASGVTEAGVARAVEERNPKREGSHGEGPARAEGTSKRLWVCQAQDTGSLPVQRSLVRAVTQCASCHWTALTLSRAPYCHWDETQPLCLTFPPPCTWPPIYCLDLISSIPAWPLGALLPCISSPPCLCFQQSFRVTFLSSPSANPFLLLDPAQIPPLP